MVAGTRLLAAAGLTTAVAGSAVLIGNGLSWGGPQGPQGVPFELANDAPPRVHQLHELRKGTQERPFDLLVIGGGATGCGVALDAATRCA